MPVVQVALPVPLPRLFDYLPPEGVQPVTGGRVIVPFGNRKMIGIVVAFSDSSDLATSQLKQVLTVLDRNPCFRPLCGAFFTGQPTIITLRWVRCSAMPFRYSSDKVNRLRMIPCGAGKSRNRAARRPRKVLNARPGSSKVWRCCASNRSIVMKSVNMT